MEYYVERYVSISMLDALQLDKAILRITLEAWSIVITENITKKRFELQSVQVVERNSYDTGKWYRFTFQVYD